MTGKRLSIDPKILAIINRLEIKTRKLISGPLAGDYRQKVKGSGYDFDQLSEYQPGDDIRFIDWKSSARTNKILVKQYLADQNRHVIVMLDVSASTEWGSADTNKADEMRRLAALLAFTAAHRKDAVGLILFSDRVEHAVGPGVGRNHTMRLVDALLNHKATGRQTNIDVALHHPLLRQHKRSIILLISDFMAPLNTHLLRALMKQHEILAFRCRDPRELTLPDCGLLTFADAETGEKVLVEGGGALQRKGLSDYLSHWHEQQKAVLKQAKIDCFDMIVARAYMSDLVLFLKQRFVYL